MRVMFGDTTTEPKSSKHCYIDLLCISQLQQSCVTDINLRNLNLSGRPSGGHLTPSSNKFSIVRQAASSAYHRVPATQSEPQSREPASPLLDTLRYSLTPTFISAFPAFFYQLAFTALGLDTHLLLLRVCVLARFYPIHPKRETKRSLRWHRGGHLDPYGVSLRVFDCILYLSAQPKRASSQHHILAHRLQ
ncbi:hypothetical protein CRG98_027830 [Punica granatum]|uniref:Uncharacterized protein n=1 Tax=Punica granatum TaxID=22663 RepID=A0A2I0J6E5_PUNGR|nr:hypothetical protein CRG98_027830 [Punica granatum]